VRGPTAADSYWIQRDKSRTFQGEWTRTGDIYMRDPDGRYAYCAAPTTCFQGQRRLGFAFEGGSRARRTSLPCRRRGGAARMPTGLLKPKAFVVLREGAARQGLEVALKNM